MLKEIIMINVNKNFFWDFCDGQYALTEVCVTTFISDDS